MQRTIKLIWDFRGPDAHKVADHFRIHLEQALHAEDQRQIGITDLTENHCITFLLIPENEMISMRDRFKPHRGEYINP